MSPCKLRSYDKTFLLTWWVQCLLTWLKEFSESSHFSTSNPAYNFILYLSIFIGMRKETKRWLNQKFAIWKFNTETRPRVTTGPLSVPAAGGPGSRVSLSHDTAGLSLYIKNFLCNIIFWKSSFSTEVLRGCFRDLKVLCILREESHRSYTSCQGQASSLRNGLYHFLLTIASQAIEKLLPCKL